VPFTKLVSQEQKTHFLRMMDLMSWRETTAMQGKGCREADNQPGAAGGEGVEEESGTDGQLAGAPIPSTKPDTQGGVSIGVVWRWL